MRKQHPSSGSIINRSLDFFPNFAGFSPKTKLASTSKKLKNHKKKKLKKICAVIKQPLHLIPHFPFHTNIPDFRIRTKSRVKPQKCGSEGAFPSSAAPHSHPCNLCWIHSNPAGCGGLPWQHRNISFPKFIPPPRTRAIPVAN